MNWKTPKGMNSSPLWDLLVATQKNNESVARHLLKKNPTLATKRFADFGALDFATQIKSASLVKILLECDANPAQRPVYWAMILFFTDLGKIYL